MKYTQILANCRAQGRPAVTIELTLPRQRKSGEFLKFYETARRVAPLADMISITDSPGAKFDCSNILPAYKIKSELGVDVMYHLTARDAKRRRTLGDVAAAYSHGLENVLALRGDSPGEAQDYKHSWQLIKDVASMNAGNFGDGRTGQPLDICIGCAVNPTIKNLEVEIAHENRLAGKARAGVQFAVTQMFFEPQQYLNCLEMMRRGGINMPLVAGILVIEGEGMINYLEKELSGIRVPDNIKAEFRGKSAEEAVVLGLERAKSTITALKNILPGVHIYNGASPAVLELAKFIRTS